MILKKIYQKNAHLHKNRIWREKRKCLFGRLVGCIVAKNGIVGKLGAHETRSHVDAIAQYRVIAAVARTSQ